jgi:phospholipid-binding lipoprotein MlaA
MTRPLLLFCLLALALSGCAGRQGSAAAAEDSSAQAAAIAAALDKDADYLDSAYNTQLIPDPLEPWNRAVFVLNDGVITFVGRPLNTAYTTITPRFFREGLYNFFRNLAFPVRFINSLLQGNGKKAGYEFSRFIINTGAGFGGLFNVASRHPELANLDGEDFGQTLGVWGVGEGLYLYWPLLGPSTVRDSVGRVGDYFLEPLSYVSPWQVSWSLYGVKILTELDGILDTYDDVTKSAIEPYTGVRDAFVQYRRAKVAK